MLQSVSFARSFCCWNLHVLNVRVVRSKTSQHFCLLTYGFQVKSTFHFRWNVSFSAFASLLLVNFMGSHQIIVKRQLFSFMTFETPTIDGYKNMLSCRCSLKPIQWPQFVKMFLSFSIDRGIVPWFSHDFPKNHWLNTPFGRSIWRTARATWNGAGDALRAPGASSRQRPWSTKGWRRMAPGTPAGGFRGCFRQWFWAEKSWENIEEKEKHRNIIGQSP